MAKHGESYWRGKANRAERKQKAKAEVSKLVKQLETKKSSLFKQATGSPAYYKCKADIEALRKQLKRARSAARRKV